MPPSTPMIRLPRTVIVAVTLCLFLAGLYGLRQYDAVGNPEHALLAVAAGGAVLAIVAGSIYANYTRYHHPGHPDPHHP